MKIKLTYRILSIIIIFFMFMTTVIPDISYASAAITNQNIYTSASSWAKSEIEKSYNSGILPVRLLASDAKQPATREELCELAVLLYEKVTKTQISPASPNPFTDTSNSEILKAYKLGITAGTSSNTFSPGEKTNREQVATMFGRTIRTMFPDDDYSLEGAPIFLDQSDISSWALDHIKFMSKAGIILGANNMFMPKAVTEEQKASGYGTTKREEAIAIAVRIFAKYNNRDISVSFSVNQDNFAKSLIRKSVPVLSEAEKFSKIDFNNRYFRPVYKPNLTLMAANGFGADGSRTYSSTPFAATVSSNGDKIGKFKIFLPSDVLSKTNKIIWQVSLVPFDGKAVDILTPAPGGLLLSGSVASNTKEFQIDFLKIEQADNALRRPNFIKNNLRFSELNPTLNISPILNPNLNLNPSLNDIDLNLDTRIINFSNILLSNSLTHKFIPPRTYYVRAYPVDSLGRSIGDSGTGLPVIYGDFLPVDEETNKVYFPIYLKIPRQSGPVDYVGEFPNNFNSYKEGRILSDGQKTYSVLPTGYPSNTQELKVQVSLIKFEGQDNWNNTPGLVYERSIFPSDPVFQGLKDTLTKGIEIDFSQFVPSDSELPEDRNIPYYVRTVAFVEGSKPGTMKALYSETITINYGKFNPQSTNLFLEQIKITPILPEVTKLSYTPIQWEAENWQYHYTVIRQPAIKDVFKFIPSDDPYTPYSVGTKLDFTPKPEQDKSWWKEAWDAITGFFENLTSFFAKVVNWVSKAYADLKMGIIKFAVSAFPEGWRGPLQKAITALVDYGLASIGIPPTLPNFDDLSSMGVDYLATVAMESAGIPANELTEYGVEKFSDSIKSNLETSTKSASPNPMDWNFIKLDSEDLYRPAYITIDLYNPSKYPTPEGMLYCTVNKQLDLSKNGYDETVTRLFAVYGASYVYLFKPVMGMKIPSLEPGQSMTVPIILEEIIGYPFYDGGPPVADSDFDMMYGYGEFNFDINISYELPPIEVEIERQKYTKDAIYSYSTLGSTLGFIALPGQSYNN